MRIQIRFYTDRSSYYCRYFDCADESSLQEIVEYAQPDVQNELGKIEESNLNPLFPWSGRKTPKRIELRKWDTIRKNVKRGWKIKLNKYKTTFTFKDGSKKVSVKYA